MAVKVWLECIDCVENDFPCILVIGDSTSAVVWQFKIASMDMKSGTHGSHLIVAHH